MDSNLLRLPNGAEPVTDADEEVSLIQLWSLTDFYVSDLPHLYSSEPETG